MGWDVFGAAGRKYGGGPLIGQISRLRLPDWDDIMNGQGSIEFTWISIDRYLDAYQFFAGGMQPLQAPQQVFTVSGINNNGAWTADPVFETTRVRPEPLTPSGSGDCAVRVMDAQANVLYESNFDLSSIPGLPGNGIESFTVQTPAFTNTARIEILSNGVLKETITRTLNAPSVTITSPQAGDALTATSKVVWQASDPDGDDLEVIVQYSHDGNAWVTLDTLADVVSGELPIAVDYLASGSSAKIRLLVTDGLNTVVSGVESLSLEPNRFPEVAIQHPLLDGSYPSTGNVSFVGDAWDAEDYSIPSSDLTWSSNVDGVLGYGRTLNVTGLSVGTHAVTLASVDSEGGVGSDSIVFDIW